MNRREFLAGLVASGFCNSRGHAGTPFPVKFRQQPGYASLLRFVEPGLDEFPGEKIALELEHRLAENVLRGPLPFAPECSGKSPAGYRAIADGVAESAFAEGNVAAGWEKWRLALGTIDSARFYSLPGDVVLYKIRSRTAARLEYRVGRWKLEWKDKVITRLEPVEEILTHADKPWFRDVTGAAFTGEPSFREQLSRGSSVLAGESRSGLRYRSLWRARDRRCGYRRRRLGRDLRSSARRLAQPLV